MTGGWAFPGYGTVFPVFGAVFPGSGGLQGFSAVQCAPSVWIDCPGHNSVLTDTIND